MRGLGGAILDQKEKSYGLRLAEQQDRRNLSFYTMDFTEKTCYEKEKEQLYL